MTYQITLEIVRGLLLLIAITHFIKDFFEGPLIMWMHKKDLSHPPEDYRYNVNPEFHATLWTMMYFAFFVI